MTTPINAQDLENRLQRLVRAQGSPSTVSVILVSDAQSISAHINLTNDDIEYQIPVDHNPEQYERIRNFARSLRLRDTRQKVYNDIGLHEVGHRRLKNDVHGLGCPEDLVGKEVAIDAVSAVMLEAGKFSPQGAQYLENSISDIINNLNGSQYTRFNGLSIFLAEQGEINNERFSPLYEAFVKLNMHLFGTPRQQKLMQHYYTNEIRIDEAVAGCIRDLSLNHNKRKNITTLFDKSQWKGTYSTFARHLVPLMDQNTPEFLPGSGSGGKGYRVPVSFDGEGKFDPDTVEDPVLRRILDSDNMKKIMQRRNQQGEGIPTFVENWRALDYFYQSEASELLIKAETPRKGEKMPIAPIQARPFDSDKDTMEDILFGRVLLDENGRPCFAVPRGHLEHTVKYKKSITGYPELNIAVLDTSISMTQSANDKGVGRTNIVEWGDNSKYHYALLAYYGVEKALHRMGVGTKTRYNMIAFSSRTEATGEKHYEDRAEIKRRILTPTFGPTTKIDATVLSQQCRQPGSVLMTMSDGEIHNWSSIKDDIKRIISDKFYVHFQIGESTSATQDLERWGATVVKIGDASEMPRKAIDITQRFYRSYAAGEVS